MDETEDYQNCCNRVNGQKRKVSWYQALSELKYDDLSTFLNYLYKVEARLRWNFIFNTPSEYGQLSMKKKGTADTKPGFSHIIFPLKPFNICAFSFSFKCVLFMPHCLFGFAFWFTVLLYSSSASKLLVGFRLGRTKEFSWALTPAKWSGLSEETNWYGPNLGVGMSSWVFSICNVQKRF